MNKFKGEVEFSYKNANYLLVPTFNCLAEIESELSQSIIAIINKISDAGLNLSEIKSVLKCALKAGGNNFQDTEIVTLIEEIGITESYFLACQFLKNVLTKN